MKSLVAALFWGSVFSLVMIFWIALERVLGLHDQYIAYHPAFSALFALPAVVIYVLALRARRLRPDAAPGWWPAFLFGLQIAVVVAVLSPLTQWLIHSVVSPQFFANVIDHTVAEGTLTAEAARAQFNLRSYLFQAVIGALVMGAITSAIVAIFQRKPKGAA